MKKLASILLASILAAAPIGVEGMSTVLTVSAEEAETVEQNGLVFSVTGGFAQLTEISGISAKTLTIPAQVNGYPVTNLTADFTECSQLTEILVEDGSKFQSIDGVLFNSTGKVLIAYPCAKPGAYTIPDGVTTIKARAFMNAQQLESITLPASLKTVEVFAFANCAALEEITGAVPGRIGSQFTGCTSLRRLEFAEADPEEEDSIVLDELTLQNCRALETLIIPKSRVLTGVAEITDCPQLRQLTICGCNGLEEITFTESCNDVDVIECQELRELYFTEIGSLHLSDCPKLEHLTVDAVRKTGGRSTSIQNCPALVSAKYYEDTDIRLLEGVDNLTIYGKADFISIPEACALYKVPFSVLS